MPRRFIAVAGNIGAGKTELVSFLCRKYGVEPFFEPNDTNPYLESFYGDMGTWAFRSQLWFLTHKFRLHRRLMESTATVVQDRTLYEDAEIFARNLYEQGHIDERDYRTYRELYETVCETLSPPDVMIFLRCPVRTLRKRIASRGRAMEQSLPRGYLERLDDLYRRWRESYDLSPVIELDTGKLDYLTDLVDRLDVMQRIERYL